MAQVETETQEKEPSLFTGTKSLYESMARKKSASALLAQGVKAAEKKLIRTFTENLMKDVSDEKVISFLHLPYYFRSAGSVRLGEAPLIYEMVRAIHLLFDYKYQAHDSTSNVFVKRSDILRVYPSMKKIVDDQDRFFAASDSLGEIKKELNTIWNGAAQIDFSQPDYHGDENIFLGIPDRYFRVVFKIK
ncbi:MAG: hypothetical protein KBC98_00370 [Candidatus Pacebacteria bacterium]|jgi:hypothetical protein|nr:hypothetical protein [Candidatus Paceibacterota bacterium]